MAITDVTVPVKYVKIQATTPTDLTEGRLWYNTTNNKTYVSDGSSYSLVADVDLDVLYKLVGTNGLNILDIIAQSTLTAGTNANFERDIYSDATGYLNTIDTGNSTAGFNTNLYENSTSRQEGLWNQPVTSSVSDNLDGIQFLANKNVNLSTVNVDNDCNGTECYLYNSDCSSLLQTRTITSYIATFDYDLASGTTYCLVCNGNNRGYANTSPNATWVDIHITYTNGVYGGGIRNNVNANILNVTTAEAGADGIVQTNAQTITSGYTNFIIVSSDEVTAGTGTIDYDISFNGGTNYQTGVSSFVSTGIVNVGTSLILKQNLTGTGSSNTASAKDWGVLLW